MASLLPHNATPLERALEGAGSRIEAVPAPLRQLWRPDECRLELLPWLAWSLSADVWNAQWPESVKRERVRSAIGIQRQKGTTKSVRDVVESFGGGIAIREWWQTSPPGDPHTFDLLLTLGGAGGAAVPAAFIDDVIAEVARTKPARSHFTFTLGISAEGAVRLAVAARPATYARLITEAPAAAVALAGAIRLAIVARPSSVARIVASAPPAE